MTLQELINAVMLKATGKSTILAESNSKWGKIRGIANYYQNAWANEPSARPGWASLYEKDRVIGSVSNKRTYDLDDDILEISVANGDRPYIMTSDGKYKTYFNLISYDDLDNYEGSNSIAKIGNTIVFSRDFKEGDKEYDGKIYLPVYTSFDDLEDADDDIIVDDPYWLVTICAAEYIRNDIVKQNQYSNLIAEANNLMTNMLRRNRGASTRRVRGNWRNPGGDI